MAFLGLLGGVYAQEELEPADWWSGSLAVDPSVESKDDAPVNIGQLKWMALKAREEFELRLIGGAGFELPEFKEKGNAKPANVGQAKHLASFFWGRLNGISTELSRRDLQSRFPNWKHNVPWNPDEETGPENHTVLTTGELKTLFSFSTQPDEDGDGLTDWQEWQIGGDATSAVPEADPDGDGFTTLEEITLGTNPKDGKHFPGSDKGRNQADSGLDEVFTPFADAGKKEKKKPRGIFGFRGNVPPAIQAQREAKFQEESQEEGNKE